METSYLDYQPLSLEPSWKAAWPSFCASELLFFMSILRCSLAASAAVAIMY